MVKFSGEEPAATNSPAVSKVSEVYDGLQRPGEPQLAAGSQ